ncbi:unnamed protein product [Ceutorhynchus assimilis]|uniref:Uncharacterized protein n=1 Tax=Ceutorhynchus assimilis TaxID=467358 RepID=A0A9N9MW37_9CUCU|nr:unnamed protein product [Ceutorhynchus assimilis]
MGKMMRTDVNGIRPRKSTGNNWTLDSPRTKKLPIFKMGENDFAVNLPHENLSYYSQVPSAPKVTTSFNETAPEVKKTISNQLRKYCENTTLHGLRYVGDTQLSFGERIFWLISFSVAIGFATYYITNIYDKWKSSPVIISFSPFDGDISKIPFPAITICNMNQAKRSEAEKILREGSNVDKKLLDDACNGNASFDQTEKISWEALRNFLTGNSCSDMLISCQWGDDKVDCDDAFNNDLTDEGLCCSFNRLPPEKIFRSMKDISILNQTYPSNVYDWHAEKGFQDTDYGDYIPRRPLGAGAHLGLSIILDAQINNYYCSSTRSVGFKVMLSNPIETPKMADFGFLISPGFENRITVQPVVREATATLRDIAIEKRQCYFSNERPLQYYRTYTTRNCNLECQSNYTLQMCECIPYHLPKSRQIKYCGKTEKDCVDQAKIDMETVVGNGSSCNCLPSCYSIEYNNHKSFARLSRRINGDFTAITSKYFVDNMAIVQVFFSSSKFTKEFKSELYGFTEILSNVGGLLSLCLGFSFLSLIELFYFVTLRVVCDIAQHTRKVIKKQKESNVIPFLK